MPDIKRCRSLFTIHGTFRVSLSEVDRQLLQRCLDRSPRAWQDFTDRFLGLVIHVSNHTASSRGMTIDQSTRDDLVAEVFLALIADDFAALRRFRRNSSFATYLSVIARRVIIRKLTRPQPVVMPPSAVAQAEANQASSNGAAHSAPDRIENRDEVRQLMLRLDPQEANVVRMYHLEGKTYHEISKAIGMSENSVGPVLTKARAKMRGGRQ